ncbi:MAG: hypothetical protein ABEH56_04640 [Salinirussus sp.]
MTDRSGWDRRRCLRVAGAGLAGALAGCAGTASDAGGGRTVEVRDAPSCAEGFTITETSATVGTGTVPEVRLRLRNEGDVPVRYDVLVVFEQGTSLGIDARTGRDSLTGTLEPAAEVVLTATDDATDIERTDNYEVSASVGCASEATSLVDRSR